MQLHIMTHHSRNALFPAQGPRALLILIGFAAAAAAVYGQIPDCAYRATPVPLATFGEPSASAPGNTELAVAVGFYGEGVGGSCYADLIGATDWFMRWRHGVSDHIDLGFDAQIEHRGDGALAGTAKVAARYFVKKGFRLEGGIGAADSGDGRSVSGDVAAVIGTSRPDKVWNYYTSIRLAVSHGCVNLFCAGGTGDRPPGAIIPLGVIGATARVSDSAQFVMETGLGGLFSPHLSNQADYVHVSVGLRFEVGKDWHRRDKTT